MSPHSDLLQGIAQSSTQLELALVQVYIDPELTVSYANRCFNTLAASCGLPDNQLISWLINDNYSDAKQLIEALEQQSTLDAESQGYSASGQRFHIQWSLSLAADNQLICLIRDIRWRQKYKDQWSLFERIFNSSRNSIVVTDENNNIVMVNNYFEEISGFSRYEVLGLDPGHFGSGRQSKLFYQELWRSLQSDGYWSGVIWNRRKDGREYPEQKTIYVVTNEQGVLTHYFSSGEVLPTIGEQSSQNEFSHGLLNQQMLINHLNENRHQYQEPVAILHVGMDRMEQAKQVCGLSFGDHIINILIKRLKDHFLPHGLMCGSIGDEVIIAAPHISTPESAHNEGLALLKSLSGTTQFEDIEWKISASVGVSFFTPDNDAWKAIEQAHVAMYHAKGKGGNNLQFYDIESQNHAKEGLRLEQALKQAIDKNELSLHYQPLIDLQQQNVFGAEALLRWHSKEFGHIGPDRFIPIAEQSDLILDIGLWVVESACRQLQQWGENYTGSVAVNLSAQQIQYADLPNKLLAILQQYQVPVDRLHLEITETAMINDTNSAISVIAALQNAGFVLSIDDFGTGYSSLSYLTRFPVDKLKVDRSFIDTMTSSHESQVVTKAIIGLAKGLGLKVVAEGVETQEQLDQLHELNCDYAQGYLLSRPLDANSFIGYCQQYDLSQNNLNHNKLIHNKNNFSHNAPNPRHFSEGYAS